MTKHPVKVIVSVETKGGKFLNAKEQTIMISDGPIDEANSALKEVEEMANKKFRKLHLPLVCRMTFAEDSKAT